MRGEEMTGVDRLTRSRAQRMLFGVAGGIARWLGVDPAFVRIAFVALALVNGVGVVTYAVLAVVLPAGDDAGDPAGGDQDPPTTKLATAPPGMAPPPPAGAGADPLDERRATRARQALGGGVALIGLWLLGRQLGLVPDLQWSVVAPLALIVVGLLLLAGRGASGQESPR